MGEYSYQEKDLPGLPPLGPSNRADRLAVQGAVLVLLGFVPGMGVAFALAGVALCVLALTGGSQSASRRRGLAKLSLAAAPFTVAGGLALLWLLSGYPDLPGQRQTTYRFGQSEEEDTARQREGAEHVGEDLQCFGNLANIGAAIGLFELENGRYPAKLSELHPQYLPDLSVFICPGSGDVVRSADDIDTHGSYGYTPPRAGADRATTRLVYDRSFGHHGGDRRQVLYIDGTGASLKE